MKYYIYIYMNMNNPRDFGVPKERKTERSNEKRVATNIQPKKVFIWLMEATILYRKFGAPDSGKSSLHPIPGIISDFVGDMMMPKNKANG